MAKHQPDYHSPLMALGKRALLWVVLPALLVVALLYSMATYKSPEQAEADRTARELKIDEALETRRRKVEELKKRLEADPAVIRLEAELSKLPPEERKKRVNELTSEYDRKARGN